MARFNTEYTDKFLDNLSDLYFHCKYISDLYEKILPEGEHRIDEEFLSENEDLIEDLIDQAEDLEDVIKDFNKIASKFMKY